jgi:hypothetical protein
MLDGFGVVGGYQRKQAALLRWQQWTGVSIYMGLIVFGTSTDIALGFENSSSEDIRWTGLVNGRLMMDYAPRCRCGVQEDR